MDQMTRTHDVDSIETSDEASVSAAPTEAEPEASFDDVIEAATTDAGEVDVEQLTSDVIETIEMVRPALQMDGGDIAFVGIQEDLTVEVQLQGACVSCPASMQTLKAGVERIVQDRHPVVKEVVAV